jgi:hypothetical protein
MDIALPKKPLTIQLAYSIIVGNDFSHGYIKGFKNKNKTAR